MSGLVSDQWDVADPALLFEAFTAMHQLCWIFLPAQMQTLYLSPALGKLLELPEAGLSPEFWRQHLEAADWPLFKRWLEASEAASATAQISLKLTTGSKSLEASYLCRQSTQAEWFKIFCFRELERQPVAQEQAPTDLQAQFAQHQPFLQSLLDQIEEGLTLVDSQGRLVFRNRTGYQLLGRQTETGQLGNWAKTYGIYWPDTQHMLPEDELPLARALRGELVRNAEVQVQNPGVSGSHLLVTASPVYHQQQPDKMIGAISIYRDITSLYLAEERLRQLTERLRYLLGRFNQGFMTFDKNWFISFFNQSAWELIGKINPVELTSQSIWQLLPEAQEQNLRFYSEFQRAVRDNVSVEFQEYSPGLDTWFDVQAYPFQGELDVFFKDMTEAHRHEQMLQLEKDVLAMSTRTDIQLQQLIEQILKRLQGIFPGRSFLLLQLEDKPLDSRVLAAGAEQELLVAWEDHLTQQCSSWREWFKSHAYWQWDASVKTGPMQLELMVAGTQIARMWAIQILRYTQPLCVLVVFSPQVRWVERPQETHFFERAALFIGKLKETWLAESELRLSHERFHFASQATNDAIWDWDFADHKVTWNQALTDLFGYSLTEMGEQIDDWYLKIHPEDRERVMTGIHRHIQQKIPNWQDAYRFRHANGSYRHVLDRGYLILGARGQPQRMIGAMQDITQSKEAEYHLHLHEQLYRSIAENFPSGQVMVLDQNLRCLFADGQEHSPALRRPIGENYPGSFEPAIGDIMTEYFRLALRGQQQRFELELGQDWYDFRIVPLEDEQSQVSRLLVVIQNITANKLATQEKNRLIQELTIKNEDLNQFTYIISHNLRAPVANLQGLVSLLEMEEEIPESIRQIAQSFGVTVNKLDEVIKDLNQILDTRRQREDNAKWVDLEAEINWILKEFRQQYPEIRSWVHWNLKITKIYTISSYIQSILYNLISNALKYRHPERVPEIWIYCSRQHGYLWLEIYDNGLGLDTQALEGQLFRLYKRFHTHTEGRGLGLYLINTQAKALGGGVEVDSTIGEGTRFQVYFIENQPEGAV